MTETNLDEELLQEYLAECREHLAAMEADLLAIEGRSGPSDPDRVNRMFRAAHSIKGGAGYLGFTVIRELAHQTENVLELIRSQELMPVPEIVGVSLKICDRLRELLSECRTSNSSDIADCVEALARIAATGVRPDQEGSLKGESKAAPHPSGSAVGGNETYVKDDIKQRSILVVDDSSFLRKMVHSALQGHGYSLVEASNGRVALEVLEKQEFRCILTDLVMPEVDGFGLLAELQKRNVQAPIIVLTADIQKSTRQRCEELGASEFIQKPVNAEVLRSALAGVFNREK